MLRFLEEDPSAAGWGLWYFLLSDENGSLTAIGNGGFKGRPAPNGDVEIGYSVLESHQEYGLATEAVTALIDWALQQKAVKRIVAHTLPDLAPSIRVLEKCGFGFAGAGPEVGVIRYELPQADQTAGTNSRIRKFRPDDTDALVAIWASASTLAHPFLTEAFIAEETANLRTQHLPNAETWVLEHTGEPAGFIALVDDEIGGLFVAPSHHGKGFGRALVDHAVAIKGPLRVEVFEKNQIGRRFYDRYGFLEVDRYLHAPSGEVTLRLNNWGQSKN